MNTRKFKKGDLVVVVKNGKIYTTYSDAFRKLGFAMLGRNDYPDTHVDGESIYQVWNMMQHEVHDRSIYALRDLKGNEILLGEDGIKLAAEQFRNLPKEFYFRLNDRYDCVISESTFKVGCQEISKESWNKIKAAAQKSGFDSSINNVIKQPKSEKVTRLTYYKYIGRDTISGHQQFTSGRYYLCIDPEDVNKPFNFIDDLGDMNGYTSKNNELFDLDAPRYVDIPVK